MALQELKLDDYNEVVKEAGNDVVVLVSQTTCMPCKVVEAQLENLASRGVKAFKVNLTNTPEFKELYPDIMSTPTLLVHDDGEMFARYDGQQQSMSLVAVLMSKQK